jgi:hypothetical protein
MESRRPAIAKEQAGRRIVVLMFRVDATETLALDEDHALVGEILGEITLELVYGRIVFDCP